MTDPFRNIKLTRQKKIKSDLKMVSPNIIPDKPGEIRLFTTIRNEQLRIPYFLKHYFQMGVDRIFVVDNDSDDKSFELLSEKKNIHIFHTRENYQNQGVWIETLLNHYGIGYWCLVIDADELLIYPHWKEISIKKLCSFLDKNNYSALHCFLLDMYSNKQIKDTIYKTGSDPLLTTRYFDTDSHIKINRKYKNCIPKRFHLYKKGMRNRVFKIKNIYLSKFPLLKVTSDTYLSAGTHSIEGANIANIQGTLLHFKYFNDFIDRTEEESIRKQHWNNAFEYNSYYTLIKKNPDLNLFYFNSQEYTKEDQLIKFGIMNSSVEFEKYYEELLY